MRFEGTVDYVATKDPTVAVNAAIRLERPLLVKGEPGTGKTELARQVASALGLRLIEWHVKSTTRAQQGLYEYDAVSRLRDSQLGDGRVQDVDNYIKPGKLWDAFATEEKVVLLADDMDPAALRADVRTAIPPLHGALLKNEQDVHLFERLAFLARRQGN
jgi:MoxR-like ATPase